MKKFYLVIISSIVIFSSCGVKRNTFITPLPNVPMFQHSSEASLNVAAAATHAELQGALSVTKHFGILAGAFSARGAASSNELGINFYTKVNKLIHFSSSAGWGKTLNTRMYDDPLNQTYHINSTVNFNTLFAHPCLYVLFEDENSNKYRIGISVKYSLNRLTKYYYREYENVFHSARLLYEKTTTAPNQFFNATSKMLSAEVNTGYLTVGGHFGFVSTTDLKASYSYKNYNSPNLNTDKKINQSFYYWPLMVSCYVGIRL